MECTSSADAWLTTLCVPRAPCPTPQCPRPFPRQGRTVTGGMQPTLYREGADARQPHFRDVVHTDVVQLPAEFVCVYAPAKPSPVSRA